MRAEFMTSAASAAGFPRSTRPEIAFLGRSNAGKSSLLNRIATARIARTSKTPGRTQTINFFEVTAKDLVFVLADLPGYGYAKAPIPLRQAWYGLIESYLSSRIPLAAVLLLFDVRREVSEEDREIQRWLIEASGSRPQVLIVGTKCDKIPKARRKPTADRLAEAFGAPRESVILTSADSGEGVEALRGAISAIAGDSSLRA